MKPPIMWAIYPIYIRRNSFCRFRRSRILLSPSIYVYILQPYYPEYLPLCQRLWSCPQMIFLITHRYRLSITQLSLRGLKKRRKKNSYRFLHLVYPMFHYQLNVITTTLECWRKQLPICGFGTKLKCSFRSRFTAIRKGLDRSKSLF